MKIVDYETFVRMPKGTIFAAWTPHVMLTDPEIKIDPGREWLVYDQNGNKKMTWGYNGTCPIIPHVDIDDGFDYGPVKTEFFFHDGDSNDTAEYKMFLIFEEEDIDNMIKVLEWAKQGCPGTDDPNEMLEHDQIWGNSWKSERFQPSKGENMFSYWETLPQYHFERDDFVKVFCEFFTSEQIVDIETLCQETTYLDDFILLYHEDEFYIFHKDSGVVINWYKHLGRTNTCNREDFTLDDLREFLNILANELGFDKRSNCWHECSYEDGRLVHDGSWVPGKWYEWRSISGETERARMKQDIPNDHFFPPSKRIFEENVIAFRELED